VETGLCCGGVLPPEWRFVSERLLGICDPWCEVIGVGICDGVEGDGMCVGEAMCEGEGTDGENTPGDDCVGEWI
jgi:hypothetical protein